MLIEVVKQCSKRCSSPDACYLGTLLLCVEPYVLLYLTQRRSVKVKGSLLGASFFLKLTVAHSLHGYTACNTTPWVTPREEL